MKSSLAKVLEKNKEAIVQELAEQVKEKAGPNYARVPMEKLIPRMELIYEALYQTILQDDRSFMERFVSEAVRQRVEEHYALMEVQALISSLRLIVLRLVEEAYQDNPAEMISAVKDLEDLTHHTRQWAFQIYLDAFEDRMEQQRRALAELSTPVIQVYENVLVLPLVGAIDTERARRIMEELLMGITHHQAELVIIDITGVPVVDTSVANHLIQTIKAARLLGARSILVGISSEIAQTLVHLRIDLTGVETRSNLQAGIEHALEQMGLEITPMDPDLLAFETVEEDALEK